VRREHKSLKLTSRLDPFMVLLPDSKAKQCTGERRGRVVGPIAPGGRGVPTHSVPCRSREGLLLALSAGQA
jgi:hypothetical protein